jgi:hypothetical protein
MQKWVARFSFTFFILAAVFAWDAYKRVVSAPQSSSSQTVRVALDCAGAGACAALAVAGIRARHRGSGE